MIFEDEPSEYTIATAAGAAVYYLLFIERGENDRTLAYQWKNQGWPGLNNDERMILTGCWMN